MNLHQTKELLARHHLAPHKRLGQNFLVHSHTAQRIVDLAGLNPEDTVVEVGVGLGALTRPLSGVAARVIGVEADSGIIRLHEELQDLPENVRLVHADILKLNLAELCQDGARLKIVANLPYSISSPFLFHLIEHREHLHSAVIMLQKELGLRLSAQPGSKVYGAPTVLLAACADVEALLEVGPTEFHPQPQVDSLVLRLSFYPEPARLKPLGDFNATLVFTLFKKYPFGTVFLTFGVGDCPAVVLCNGSTEAHLLNRIDAGDFGGGTRFVTMPSVLKETDFSNRFSCNIFPDFDKLVLMTDGIYDAKFPSEAALTKPASWKDFWADLAGENEDGHKVDFLKENTSAGEQLLEWLQFWSTGNHDDRTLAIVF